MRYGRVALLSILALVTTSNARADNEASGWVNPKFEVLHAKWPRAQDGTPIFGKLTLDCGVAANGYATDCKVQSSDPADQRLEQAAPSLASLFKSRTPNRGRAPLILSLSFDTPPDWLQKPSIDRLMAVFPRKAVEAGRSGHAVIRCVVKIDGLLRSCTVTSETPAGFGFGGAALVLAPTFLMKPAIKAGRPVEAEVDFPIDFDTHGGWARGRNITVVSSAVWSKTPTIAEISSALDEKVGDRFADGKVAFQCEVIRKTGKLADCAMVNASPGMTQFQGVARSLIPEFQVNPDFIAQFKEAVMINLTFSFPDMASETWSKRYLSRPTWIRKISADPNQPIFPKEAAEAGLTSGTATVDCKVAVDGALTQCETVSESTPGVGFGDTAKKIAEVFAANPWTEDGLPADGAHVRLPIKMVYNREATPPPTAPTPATKPEVSPGSPPPAR